ncbi:MAG TPA: HAD-IIA family hydrolase [Thermodesulfobacteriota bacterium]|nr:HAD-IIA family hydrolase [Thermodesulfobacteriota bacterium]
MRLADLFDCFLIDLDGVVYVGDNLTEGAAETLEELKKSGKIVIFLTNDPRKTAAEYSEKLRAMGIAVSPGDVVTSGMAIAYHIRGTHPDIEGKKAYVVGSASLKEEIRQTGLSVVSGEEAKHADFVIVGGHPDFHYEELKLASLAVRRGAEFYATNRDPVYPTPEGLVPATGAMLAAIETACGRKAVVAGKPEVIVFEVALSEHMHRDRERFAIIGDRIDTDVQGGKNSGIGTILALTGSTSEEDVIESEIKPDYLIRDLRDLLGDITE